MATPNGRGGWDISDEEAQEVIDKSFGEDSPSTVEVAPPTEPGWYAYSGGRQHMIFLLRDGQLSLSGNSQWYVVLDNGDVTKCEWGYIEQCLGVWDLVPLVPQVTSVEKSITESAQFGEGLRIGG